jgi:flagellar basal-body rod modification protein FlgD
MAVTDAVTSSSGNIYGTVDTTAASKTNSTSSDDFGAGMGKDTFLKLLVAQLKYQNPLSPTDSDQYMAQMAQFTQVEKLADIQKSQTDLLNWQRTVAGQGMIGKQVTATPSDGTGQVDGRVVGLKLTDTGPRLVLDNGLTVSVDEVTDVEDGSSSSSGASTNSSTSTGTTGAGSSSTGTTGTGSSNTGTTSSGTSGTGTSGTGSSTSGGSTSGGTTGTGTTGTTSGSTTSGS